MEALADRETPLEPVHRPSHRRHIAFCRAVAHGETYADAYRRHIKSKSPYARKTGWALVKRFSAYIGNLRKRLLEQADHHSIVGKVELLQRASRNIRSDP